MSEYTHIIQAMRALAAGCQPKTDISEMLCRHKCFYLLSRYKISNTYTDQWKSRAMFNRICVRERYQACGNIFQNFEEEGIPYAVIKGAVLSEAAYGNLYSRCSGDIDVLVNRRDVDRIKRMMQDSGFVQGCITENGIEPFSRKELLFQSAMSHQTAPFVKACKNPVMPYVNVDINMDIMWGESRKKADMDLVLGHTVPVVVDGIPVRKLEPEMEFISLCLHHYKDMNSVYLLAQGSLKLSLFCDIYLYLKNVTLDLNRLDTLCKSLDVGCYIYYCIYYCNVVFEDEKIRELAVWFYSEQGEALLNRFGLEEWEQQEWEMDFWERLFGGDLYEYFRETLPEKVVEKIEVNIEMM